MRDRLVHVCFGVDNKLVWEAIKSRGSERFGVNLIIFISESCE